MPLDPFRQQEVSMRGHNQDDGDDTLSQDTEIEAGTAYRASHLRPGHGPQSVRGDVVDIRFENGKVKSLALSIAPLRII
jgi:hypothetical protein